MARRHGPLLQALLVATFALVALGDECPADEGPVTCKACIRGDDINALDGIPRLNRRVQGVSSNLGDYDSVYTCEPITTPGADPVCELATVDVAAVSSGGGASATDILSWGESLAIYSAFAFVLALVFGVFACGTLFFRHCCCCCCGRYGTCGQTAPTLWEHGFPRLGFEIAMPKTADGMDAAVVPVQDEVPDAGATERLVAKRVAYPNRARWLNRAVLYLYAALVIIFVIVGQERGNLGLTEAQKTLAAAPSSVVTTVQALTVPLTALVIDTAADVLAPGLRDMNTTFTGAVDLPAVQTDMQCLLDGLNGRLPSAQGQLDFVDDLEGQIAVLNSSLDALEASILALNTSLGAGDATIATGQGQFGELDGGLGGVEGNATLARAALARMQGNVSVITHPTTGGAATADAVDGVGQLPNSADAQAGEAIFDTATSTTTDSGGDSASPPYGRRAANIVSLGALNASFAAQAATGVTLAELADNLEALSAAQTALADANGDSKAFTDATNALLASLAALPSPSNLNDTLVAINDFVLDVPVPAVLAAIDLVNASLTLTPNFALLDRELAAFDDVIVAANCAAAAGAGLQGLNVSVVQLPDLFSDVDATLAELNDTRDAAAEALADAREASANATAGSEDARGVLANSSSIMADAFNASRPQFNGLNLAQRQSALSGLDGALGGVNGTSGDVGGELDGSRTTLSNANASPPPAFLTALRAASTIVTTAASATATGLADYVTWHESGRCSLDLAVVCDATVAGSCGVVGPCITGTSVCDNSATPCTDDVPCGAGSCLFQEASFLAAEAALGAYWPIASGLAPPSTLAPALRDSQTAVAGLNATLSSADADLADLQASLGSVDTNSTLQSLNSVAGSLSGDALDLPGVTASIADARVATAIDLSPLTGSASDVNGTLDTLEILRGDVEDADRALDDLATFLFAPSGLESNLAQLDRTRLTALSASQGLRALLVDVAGVLDGVVNSTNGIASGLGLGAGGNTSLVSLSAQQELNDTNALDRVDAVDSDRYSRYGPYHFMAALYNPPSEPCVDGAVCAVDPETQNTADGTVFRDAEGEEWPEGRWCLTLDCINAQIDELNKGPLADSGDFASVLPLTVSREAATFLPYLIPLFMAFTAVLPALWLAGRNWHSYPVCASMVCVSCCAPLIFFLVGGLFFPLIIMGHDVCRGGANALYTVTQSSAHGFCVDYVGGDFNVTTGACSVQGVGSTAVEVDLPGTVGAILGDCSAFPNAVGAVYDELRDSVQDAPITTINDTVKGSQGDVGAIRPALAGDLRGIASGMSNTSLVFLDGMEEVVGCSALNDRGIGPIKEAVCCDVMTSFYWLVASWYLIGFSQCLCGWWGSLCGYKRLPNVLWGDAFEDVVEDEVSKTLQRDQALARRKRRSQIAVGLSATALGAGAGAALPPKEEEGGWKINGSRGSTNTAPLSTAPLEEEGGGASSLPHIDPASGGWTTTSPQPSAFRSSPTPSDAASGGAGRDGGQQTPPHDSEWGEEGGAALEQPLPPQQGIDHAAPVVVTKEVAVEEGEGWGAEEGDSAPPPTPPPPSRGGSGAASEEGGTSTQGGGEEQDAEEEEEGAGESSGEGEVDAVAAMFAPPPPAATPPVAASPPPPVHGLVVEDVEGESAAEEPPSPSALPPLPSPAAKGSWTMGPPGDAPALDALDVGEGWGADGGLDEELAGVAAPPATSPGGSSLPPLAPGASVVSGAGSGW